MPVLRRYRTAEAPMTDGRAALEAQYTSAYELHAEGEQLAVALGDFEGAAEHHKAALLIAWSLTAEIDDKPPNERTRRDWCHCVGCLLAQTRRVG